MAKFIDIHSHIAWGIDDGMPSIEDAQSALESAKLMALSEYVVHHTLFLDNWMFLFIMRLSLVKWN